MRGAILVIGNEILSGKVADVNVAYLSGELRAVGAELRRVVIVPDEIDVIADAVRELSAAHDFVVTTGGVGPTHDDVTIEAVARAFGRRVVRHPDVEATLRSFYRDRLTEGHLRMADVPEGALLISSEEMRWPTILVENVYVLPGLPEILRMKFAILRERFRGTPYHLRNVYVKLDEGYLKPHLDAVVAEFPDVQVGSYPRFDAPDWRVRITLDGKDRARVDRATEALVSRLSPEDLVEV